jgi:hypothetical protein
LPTGRPRYDSLQKWIDTFFAKRFGAVNATGFLIPKQFEDVCFGGRLLCVIVKENTVTPEIEPLRKSFAKRGFAWLVGIPNMPYSFMEKQSRAWIYDPRKDAFAAAETVDGLRELLEAVKRECISDP